MAEQLEYEKWGDEILTTGVLAILLTAPAGAIRPLILHCAASLHYTVCAHVRTVAPFRTT